MAWSVRAGDSLEVLPILSAASVDAIVCDPPYGIDFQGQAWDGRSIRRAANEQAGRRLSAGEAFEAWATAWALESARVLKPGGHLAAFGAPRTFHRLVSGLEDAGLEIRDVLLWLYGTGMPKSRRLPGGQATALKPAYEPILLARKPPLGSVERNLHTCGTGALNIGACRVEGRWPANVVFSHAPGCRDGCCCQTDCPVELVDASGGDARVKTAARRPVSRLFYCSKASRRERNAGCEHLPHRPLDLFPTAAGAAYTPPTAPNAHPTVKPLSLMRWLVRLATPAGGTVLDPFCGSGSTGCAAVLEGRSFLGVELNAGLRRHCARPHRALDPMPRNQRGIALSDPARKDQDGRLEIVLRVVPLTGPQADALRQRQLAAIVTLLRRAAMRTPGVPPRRRRLPLNEVSP